MSGVSGFFDRAARQRAADQAGKPERIADLGRGLAALIPPVRCVPPESLGIGKSIFGEGIIPPRFPIPERVKSQSIRATDDSALAPLFEKLRLEDERVRRMLPDLPAGYSWRGEVESMQELDFAAR